MGIRDKGRSTPRGATRADSPIKAPTPGATGVTGLSMPRKAGLGCLSAIVALGVLGSCLGSAGAGDDASKPAPTVTVTTTVTETPAAAPTVTSTVTQTVTTTVTATATATTTTTATAAAPEPAQDAAPASEPTTAQPRPLVQQPEEESPTDSAAVSFASCAEARAAGAAPLHGGDPGYSRRLDRYGDGVACEG